MARHANATRPSNTAACAASPLPPARMLALASFDADGEPARLAEVAMLGDSVFFGQDAGLDVAARKVGDRVATRLVKQHDVLAVDHVLITELDTHPPQERLGVQNPL